jgi:Zn finger protein HypA/HybF involved in hydrogenase expression
VDTPRQPGAAASGPQDVVATAREKFNCPACGGEAQWNPSRHALICPYCGTESPAELLTRNQETVIVEYDLVAALRAVPDSARGWQAEKISVQCQSCRAISVFDPAKISKSCEFCGSTALVPYEQVKDAFRPESLLPLRIAEPRARELMRAWYGRQWLAPNGFAGKALTDTVRGVYLPYWTFDAKVHARWTAESGTYYYTRVNNKQVRQVRWSPASGQLSHTFDDDLVGASMGVHAGLLRSVEPFPTTELVPYDAGYLSGWMVERYQIDLVAAATRSRQQMDAALREMCARQVPGDTYRNLDVSPTYSDQTFKHILAPIWMATYVYRGKSFQVVVNGVTGKIAGERPWSWIKIGLLVLIGVVVFLVLMSLQE